MCGLIAINRQFVVASLKHIRKAPRIFRVSKKFIDKLICGATYIQYLWNNKKPPAQASDYDNDAKIKIKLNYFYRRRHRFFRWSLKCVLDIEHNKC